MAYHRPVTEDVTVAYRRGVAEVPQHLADVLDHRHLVSPAVRPELRGGELPPQEDA